MNTIIELAQNSLSYETLACAILFLTISAQPLKKSNEITGRVDANLGAIFIKHKVNVKSR